MAEVLSFPGNCQQLQRLQFPGLNFTVLLTTLLWGKFLLKYLGKVSHSFYTIRAVSRNVPVTLISASRIKTTEQDPDLVLLCVCLASHGGPLRPKDSQRPPPLLFSNSQNLRKRQCSSFFSVVSSYPNGLGKPASWTALRGCCGFLCKTNKILRMIYLISYIFKT